MPLSTNCSKWGTHDAAFVGENYHADFKYAWKGKGLKMLTPITSNQNGQKFNKNLEVMTKATKAQLSKHATKAMTLEEINLVPPLEMGRATC